MIPLAKKQPSAFNRAGIAGASFMSSEHSQSRMWATAMNVLKAVPGFELTVVGGRATIKLDKPAGKK